MYICKDCGTKFAQKVEYCDCGNNTFDFVEDKPQTVKKSFKPKRQPLSYEQKSELISRLFVIFCILLSVIVWAIPVKTDVTTKENQAAENNLNKVGNIPSLDSFWDNTPVYVEKNTSVPEPTVINETPIPLTTIPDYAKPKLAEQKKTAQQKTQQKINSQPKQVQSPVTNKQTTAAKASVPKQTAQAARSSQKNQANPVQKQETKRIINTPSPKLYENNAIKIVQRTQPQKPAYNLNSPEMLRYKGNLRAAMFSKFAVGSIQGSGSCSVKFSVDSTGKLVNRGFLKQSDNKSLNDAVYYMMMSVPKFSPPPSGYNGETIQMNFNINNGSYEISIY